MEANSNFNMQELADDISIITVTEPFDFSDPHVQPIETFKTDDAPIPDGTTCVSTGKINRTSLNLSKLVCDWKKVFLLWTETKIYFSRN